jgi:predicted RNA-binding Zn ribbon-like protein
MLEWLGRNGTATTPELDPIRRKWSRSPQAAARAYETAVRLRESIYQLFISCIAHQEPPFPETNFLGRFLWRRPTSLQLQWDGERLNWRTGSNLDVVDLLWPIALSAAQLMTGSRAEKIRQCQDDRGCGWLFVDESRLQNRRWCSMGDCGNLAKARRHRQRVRT